MEKPTQTRNQGGSYSLDAESGALTLTERTEGLPFAPPADEVDAIDGRQAARTPDVRPLRRNQPVRLAPQAAETPTETPAATPSGQ